MTRVFVDDNDNDADDDKVCSGHIGNGDTRDFDNNDDECDCDDGQDNMANVNDDFNDSSCLYDDVSEDGVADKQ